MQKLITRRSVAGTVVLTLLIVAWSAPALSQPRIEFDQTKWNFGRLLEGEMTTHTYKFQNKGDRPLEISKVEVTCGCTAALLSDSVVAAGGRGDIKVTFNSTGRVGNQNKSLFVHTNDPKHKSVELAVEGNVYLYVRASPRTLSFGDVPRGESKTMTVTLTPWEGTEFEILNVEPPSKYFMTQRSSGADSWKKFFKSVGERLERKFGHDYNKSRSEIDGPPITGRPEGPDEENTSIISVTLLPTAPVGQHSGHLKIYTDVKERPVIEVALHAKVVGDLIAAPRHRNLGSIKRGESKEAVFNISSRANRGFRVTGVECNSEHATVEHTQVPGRHEHQIRVTISPDAPVGQLHGTVTVSTDDEDEPKLEMIFYGKVTD